MRTIKFKLFHHGDIVGYEKHEYDDFYKRIEVFHSRDNENWNYSFKYLSNITHDDKKQYINIDDINGIEIYEGDKIQLTIRDEDSALGRTFVEIWFIKWDNKLCGFCLSDGKYHVLGEWNGTVDMCHINHLVENLVVIGNIHEGNNHE